MTLGLNIRTTYDETKPSHVKRSFKKWLDIDGTMVISKSFSPILLKVAHIVMIQSLILLTYPGVLGPDNHANKGG